MHIILAQDLLFGSPISVGIIGAIVSLVASLIAKLWGTTYARHAFKTAYFANAKQSADPDVETRIVEAREALSRQQTLVTSNRMMSVLLTIGQYIIGGVLATSYIQDSLPRSSIAIFGVLVLVSSLVQQHFRPDIQMIAAMQRVVKLKALIRDAEDDVAALRSEYPGALPLIEIRRMVSEGLAEIETLEVQQASKKHDTNPPKRRRA